MNNEDNKTKNVTETEELLIEIKRWVLNYWRYEIIFTVGLLIGWLI